MITVKDLANKYNMREGKVRRILRNQGIRRKRHKYEWREETKTLANIEAILSRFRD